jgi:ferritin
MARKTLKGLHRNPAELASGRLVAALNAQVGNEMHASLQYVSIAAHFDSENLPQLASFFYRQAAEERDHALKFVKFIVDVGGRVAIPAVAAPKAQFASASEAVRLSLDWERTVTDQIYALVDVAKEDGNYIAQRFLDWFVDEQLEEITLMDQLLALVERAAGNLILVEDYLSRNALVAEAADGGGAKE